MTTIHIFTCDD